VASAYIDALEMLGRRELSEVQIRQRLARRGHDEPEIDGAVARLKEERAIDDARVAAAIAHTEVTRKRGRLRVNRQIQSAGIDASVAKEAVDEAFQSVDDDSLIEAALAKRLKGRERAADDREWGRLYRYLIGQGFEAERVGKLLRRRRPLPSGERSG
jgi:regulatory protein